MWGVNNIMSPYRYTNELHVMLCMWSMVGKAVYRHSFQLSSMYSVMDLATIGLADKVVSFVPMIPSSYTIYVQMRLHYTIISFCNIHSQPKTPFDAKVHGVTGVDGINWLPLLINFSNIYHKLI